MKLVVGLGNPGRKYEATRHNVGFEVLGRLAQQFGQGRPRARFEGEVVEAQVGQESLLLLTPLTYMNRSGQSVRPAADFYKLQPDDVLVVCDDFSLPVGRLRFRPQGSAGGQKGLNDVIRALGTQEVPRLRIGIGPVPDRWDPADFVLGKFGSDEREVMDQIVARAADGVADWVRHDVQFCMNEYNGG